VRGALNKIDGVAKIEADAKTRTCSFMVPQDLDVSEKLAEISKGNSHMKGYTITSDGGAASEPAEDAASPSESPKTSAPSEGEPELEPAK